MGVRLRGLGSCAPSIPVAHRCPHTKIMFNVKRNGQRKTLCPHGKASPRCRPPPPPPLWKTLATPLLIHDSEILMPRSHLPVKLSRPTLFFPPQLRGGGGGHYCLNGGLYIINAYSIKTRKKGIYFATRRVTRVFALRVSKTGKYEEEKGYQIHSISRLKTSLPGRSADDPRKG